MKKRPANEDSDEFDVDEPEEFQESGSDWDPEDEDAAAAAAGGGGGKKRKTKGKAAPKKAKNSNTKKKKVEKPPSEEEEEDEEDEEEEEEDEEDEESEDDTGGNGTFVVLKTDFQAGGNPTLWKIDGKALLQKYVPFEQDGKTLYKNTSTYSGWTQSNRDQYTAAPVTYVQQGKKEIIIEFNKDKVKIEDKKEDGKIEGAPATESVDA